MDKKIDIQDVMKLHRLFKIKNWNINANEEFVFDNFCHLLNNLNDEQKELIHELATNYLWMPSSEYEPNFNKIFNTVYTTELGHCKQIYLIPIVKISERGKNKSSNHCVYLVKGIVNLNHNYSKIKTDVLDNFDLLKNKQFKDDGSEMLFFIDDFVGTGDTFQEGWIDISQNKSITPYNTILISLIFQNVGFEFIKNHFGFSIYCLEPRPKGISDHFTSPAREEKIRIMQEIEKIIKPGSFSFGYKSSEALVTMIRTPNNTFPVFWKKYKIREQEFNPPFLRN